MAWRLWDSSRLDPSRARPSEDLLSPPLLSPTLSPQRRRVGGEPGGMGEALASGWEAPAGGWPGGTAPECAHMAGGKGRLFFLYS